MRKWIRLIAEKAINVGTPLVLMGAPLGLQMVRGLPLRQSVGYNYAEALAFLTVGLVHFHRRFISEVLDHPVGV